MAETHPQRFEGGSARSGARLEMHASEEDNAHEAPQTRPEAVMDRTQRDKLKKRLDKLQSQALFQWFPFLTRILVRVCAWAGKVLTKMFGDGVYYYRKGEGYPRIQIIGSSITILPIEELRCSAKARENLEAMQRAMAASFAEQQAEEEQRPDKRVKKNASTRSGKAAGVAKKSSN